MVKLPVNPLQLWKAPEPIKVTELGMTNCPVKLLQLRKAEGFIAVTEIGITVFLHPEISVFVLVLIMALQLSLES